MRGGQPDTYQIGLGMARRKFSAHVRRARRVEKAFRERKAKERFYQQQKKRLAPFVPKIARIRRKKKLTASDKATIRHFTKRIGSAAKNLRPVTAAQARKFKAQLYAPGVRAIELSGTTENAKVTVAGDDILVSQNGRTWVYWRVDRATVKSKRGMKSAAQRAFDMQFPIEKVAALAREAFAQYNVVQVHLWSHSGRVGVGFETLERFISWIDEKWQAGRYLRLPGEGGSSDPAKWVNGIAILVEKGSRKKKPAKQTAARKRSVTTEMG